MSSLVQPADIMLSPPVLDEILKVSTGGTAKPMPNPRDPQGGDPTRSLRLLTFVLYKVFDITATGRLDRLMGLLSTSLSDVPPTYNLRFIQVFQQLKPKGQGNDLMVRRRVDLDSKPEGDLNLTVIANPTQEYSDTDDDDKKAPKRARAKGVGPVSRRVLEFCTRHLAAGARASLMSLGFACMSPPLLFSRSGSLVTSSILTPLAIRSDTCRVPRSSPLGWMTVST